MNNRLTKIIGRLLLFILAVTLTVVPFPGTANSEEMIIDINPSPYVINIGDEMYSFVIHTNISYGLVAVPAEVTVNAVRIFAWKRDSLGYFDAIVRVEDLGLAPGGYNTLLLEGETVDGDKFYGIEDLLVIDKGEGRGKIFK